MYDRDNSGRITSRTLKFLLRGLGDNVREEEIDCKLRAMDIDGSSSIDFSEFLQYMLEKANRQNLYSDILEIFKLFDGSQTGYLSKIEIKNITRGMLEDRTIEEFCRAADPHGEGEVNYTAFLDRLLK
jgi:Ca2+-binding EF-hand superfamily protein